MKKEIIEFIQGILKKSGKEKVVIGVSGGIDSATSLTLATQSLGAENVITVMMPYGEQDTSDGQAAIDFNQISTENQHVIDIKPNVDQLAATLRVPTDEQVRLGNMMARIRMIILYDFAKKENALVCGTENKSEKYLGYFTRFGDEASDMEPLVGLYKTQVKELAQELGVPQQLITKSPSANLWEGQTDEVELGFSYEVADQVLVQLVDEQKTGGEIEASGVEAAVVEKVVRWVEQAAFKQQVPYTLD